MSRASRCLLVLTLALATAVSMAAVRPTAAYAGNSVYLGAPPVRWGQPPGFDLTRLGSAPMSKHLLNIGDKVTEQLVNNGGSSWSWPVPSGFQVFSGCEAGNVADGTGDTACVLKAVSPTVSAGQPDCGNTVQIYSGYGCFHNWTVAVNILITNGQGTGHTADYYAILPNQYPIEGRIVDKNGNYITPAQPVTITVTPSTGTADTATTDGTGHYGRVLEYQDSAVNVSASDGYVAYACPGTIGHAGSCTINLNHDYTGTSGVDFVAPSYTIAGDVVGGDGKGAGGVTVAIQGPTDTTATTDANGHFSVDVPNAGSYSVTPQPKGSELPVASSDCTPQNVSCQVTLNPVHRTATVKFGACVIPNPDGSPLPANTPDPIPGVVNTGTLQAVGCFTPAANQDDYSTTSPVRLDGVDVNPGSGATITVHKTAHTVTSDGPVSVLVGGHVLYTTDALNLDYTGSDAVTDQSVGISGPSGYAGIEGIPFKFFGPAGGLTTLPWQTSQSGETSLTLGLGIPVGGLGTWVPKLGQFLVSKLGGGLAGNLAKAPVGVSGTLKASNRMGLLTPKICGDVGGIQPWGEASFTFGPLQLCYDSAAGQQAGFAGGVGRGQWTFSAEFGLPPGGQFGVSKSIKVTGGFVNYQINQGSITGQHLGVALGSTGVFLQSLGVGFTRDLVNGTAGSLTGTAGISFGPEASLKAFGATGFLTKLTDPVSIAAITGSATITPYTNPLVWKVNGNLVFFNGAPISYTLANGYVTYSSPVQANVQGAGATVQGAKLDFGGNLSIGTHGYGLVMDAKGFYDPQRALVQFGGAGTLKLPSFLPVIGGVTKVQAQSNTVAMSLCDDNNGYKVGVDINFFPRDGEKPFGFTLFGTPYEFPFALETSVNKPCNLSNYDLSNPHFDAITSAVHRRAQTLNIPRGLKGITLTIKGIGGAPKLALRGPGLRLRGSALGLSGSRRVLVDREPYRHSTVIVLIAPRGGRYRLSELTGSVPIANVQGAGARRTPAAAPRSISAVVTGTPCQRVLRYAQVPQAGQRVALYEVDPVQRQFLGYATGSTGVLAFTPTQAAVGAGQIQAQPLQGTMPVGPMQTLATFPTRATDPPLAPTSLALQGRTLIFAPGCGASTYVVKVVQGRRTLTLANDGATAKLPAGLHGRLNVTVTPFDASGTAGAALRRTVTA